MTQTKEEKEFELMKAKLWHDIAVAVAGAVNAVAKESVITWADRAADHFDSKFRKALTAKVEQ